ncbi:hypothetical protein, partial [Klebsiella pneumoniae]|uniref:hypothetical protein n=1 Tax=Klebsiella pneumoniae TaxID=573 RepID=UPI00273130BD
AALDRSGQYALDLDRQLQITRPRNTCRAAFRISGGFMDSINSRIAEALGVRPQQVEAAVALLLAPAGRAGRRG